MGVVHERTMDGVQRGGPSFVYAQIEEGVIWRGRRQMIKNQIQ